MEGASQFLDFNAAAAAQGDAAALAAAAAAGTAIPGMPGAITAAVPGNPAFDMAAAAAMAAYPGFDAAAWAGIAFPSLVTAPPPVADLTKQVLPSTLGSSSGSGDKPKADKVDRSKAPPVPPGGDIVRLRGLPWSAGTSEIAAFLHEYGIKESDVKMCVTESGRQDGHAWVIFASAAVAKKAMQEKHRSSLGGRYIEIMPWRDPSQKSQVAVVSKVYFGVLKHFDAFRKAGYIYCVEAEGDIGNQDIYAFKDVLERGRARVGDSLAFPLHWSPKGQPQASSPLIRLASIEGYAHCGTFSLVEGKAGGARSGAGVIDCQEVKAVFGKGVFVGPALAQTLVPGSTVAFNAYLQSMPLAFAQPPLDGPNVPIASSVHTVDANFVSPGPDLNETKTFAGFEHSRSHHGKGGYGQMPGHVPVMVPALRAPFGPY